MSSSNVIPNLSARGKKRFGRRRDGEPARGKGPPGMCHLEEQAEIRIEDAAQPRDDLDNDDEGEQRQNDEADRVAAARSVQRSDLEVGRIDAGDRGGIDDAADPMYFQRFTKTRMKGHAAGVRYQFRGAMPSAGKRRVLSRPSSWERSVPDRTARTARPEDCQGPAPRQRPRRFPEE